MVMLEAREVAQDQGPGERADRRGRLRRPIILANLDVEDEVVEILGGEDEVGSERHDLAGHGDVDAVRGRSPETNQRFS